jgi:membrane protease YdiL (CAAX protease family)
VNSPVFLAAAALFALAWGRLLPCLDERARTLSWIVFRLMNYSRLSFSQGKSLLLTVAYLAFGVLGALVFAAAGGLKLFSLLGFELRFVLLILLGIVAEISLSNLLVGLYAGLFHHGDAALFRQIGSIPWIVGIRRLPATLARLAPAASAICEEFFFRGVLLSALTARFGLRPWLALALVTVLFVVQQGLQLKTRLQFAVIFAGSLAISAIGGILVLATASALPACLCHASFVLFYLRRPSGEPGRAAGGIS